MAKSKRRRAKASPSRQRNAAPRPSKAKATAADYESEIEVSVSLAEFRQEFASTFRENFKVYWLWLAGGVALIAMSLIAYAQSSEARVSFEKLSTHFDALPMYQAAKIGQETRLVGTIPPRAPVFKNGMVSYDIYDALYDRNSRTYRYTFKSEVTRRFPVAMKSGQIVQIANDDFRLWFDKDPRFPGLFKSYFWERIERASERSRFKTALGSNRYFGLMPGRSVIVVGVKTADGIKAQVAMSGPLERISAALREKAGNSMWNTVFKDPYLLMFFGLLVIAGVLLIWAYLVHSGIEARKRAEARHGIAR